jgi:hydrogenase/urease accessory protein HupE
VLGLLLGAIASPALAHQSSYSYADLRWCGARVELKLAVHRDDAAAALGLADPAALLHPAVLAREAAPLAAYLERGLHVSGDGRALALALVGVEPLPEKRRVSLSFIARAGRPIGRLSLEARLFPRNSLHETFLNAYVDGRLSRQEVLSPERPGVELYARGAAGMLAVMRTFIGAGIHHIFIGPDHILFIVGLMLLGGGLARVLKVATAFTLAHSVTLALAATGAVNVPSRLVEPLIAASIVYVGIENLLRRGRGPDRRVALAFGFGLVHGLGFAGVLRDFGLPKEALAWSLVAFNIGVEIGQACIVLAVTPALGALRARRPALAWRAVTVGSCGIIAAGGFWFVQRVVSPA